MVFVNLWLIIINDLCIFLYQWGLETGGPGARTPLEMRFCREKIFQIRKVSFFVLLGPPPAVWPESLGPKTPKGNLKTPKKNTMFLDIKNQIFDKIFQKWPSQAFLLHFFISIFEKFQFFYWNFSKNFNFFLIFKDLYPKT